jgi:hypothetical protein
MGSLRTRIGPALLLMLLAPVVAEFLLGDFSIRNLPVLLGLLPLYGGGALLIRDVARRRGRGWPTILLLAAAYALIEEGLLTQSLFNPNYAGQRLLDFGYIPALGTSLNWSLFVLSIHVVWSVATPILIAEGVAGREGRTMRWVSPSLPTAFFTVGCLATWKFTQRMFPFMATRAEFATIGVLALLAIVAAFAIKPRAAAAARVDAGRAAPAPWVVGLFTFLIAIAFLIAEPWLHAHGFPAAANVLARAACEIVAILMIVRWSRQHGWSPMHYLAIATATVLTYALFGLFAFSQGQTHLGVATDAVDITGEIGLTVVILLLIAWGARRSVVAVTVTA